MLEHDSISLILSGLCLVEICHFVIERNQFHLASHTSSIVHMHFSLPDLAFLLVLLNI